jgi:hypothetical protein
VKGWWQVVAWLAFGAVCWAANAAGFSPKPTPGWLIIAAMALVIYGGSVMDKGRNLWTDHGWCFAAVENVVLAGVLYLIGLALMVAAFFAQAPK